MRILRNDEITRLDIRGLERELRSVRDDKIVLNDFEKSLEIQLGKVLRDEASSVTRTDVPESDESDPRTKFLSDTRDMYLTDEEREFNSGTA